VPFVSQIDGRKIGETGIGKKPFSLFGLLYIVIQQFTAETVSNLRYLRVFELEFYVAFNKCTCFVLKNNKNINSDTDYSFLQLAYY